MTKRRNEKLHRTNWEISQHGRVDDVRVVGIEETGVYTLKEAVRMAEESGEDLIEISPKANPPVCKIMEYTKFLYDIKKKKKEQDKKNRENQSEMKELRFGPNTDTHDFDFKKKHASEWLKNGDKVKSVVVFRGREMQFKEKGEIMLLKLADELSEISTVENLPRMEGNKMTMILKQKK